MVTGNSHNLIPVLERAMMERALNKTSLSRELGISHATVRRWFSGVDRPGAASCLKIARFLGISVVDVMAMAGCIPEMDEIPPERLPEFREYIETKYPNLLEEAEVGFFEQLIERCLILRGGVSD